MDAKPVKKFLAFMQENDVKTDILLDYQHKVSVGEFHFVNGAHFPVLIPGLNADGVYVDNEYIIGEYERDKETTLVHATNYCRNRGCILPPPQVRDKMISAGKEVTFLSALNVLGFPPIQGDAYWAEGDSPYVSDGGLSDNVEADAIENAPPFAFKRVRGCKRVLAKSEVKADHEKSPYGWVLDEMMEQTFSYQDYLDGLGKSFPVAGWYFSTDGTFSADTLCDREAGICVTPNLCLSLNIYGAKMTAEETREYQKFYGVKVPLAEHLVLMQKYASEINQALDAIDMDDVHVPDSKITKKCWSKEELGKTLSNPEKSDNKRWFLPVIELKTVPIIYAALAEFGVGMKKE